MAHHTPRSYLDLQRRLDLAPQGAPASDALFAILAHLFSEREASLVAVLPITFFSLAKAAALWKLPEAEARILLDGLADKGIIVDFSKGDTRTYALAPPMAGFFEFSLMRTDGRFDTALLSELFHRYINEEDAFVRAIFGIDPPIERTFVQEDQIRPEDQSCVLDYERASHAVTSASFVTVGRCYCRHKMEHLGRACDAPQDVCLTFNDTARSLAAHGIAREITSAEGLAVLARAMQHGLVQIGSNQQESVTWICNCCRCCCEALLAYRRLGYNPRIHTNFVAVRTAASCSACGRCVRRCPADALTIDAAGRVVAIDEERCLGCGVCVRFCSSGALILGRRPTTKFVPKDTFERTVLMAIDTGTLQNVLFDHFDLWTYDLLRRFLGIVLRLPPVQRALATRQLRSRYMTMFGKLYRRHDATVFEGRDPDYSHPELGPPRRDGSG